MTGETFIYALKHPTTGEIRYIGKANNIGKRLKGHMRETRRVSPLYSWIKKLSSEGLKPAIQIVSTVPMDDWKDEEKRQIIAHRQAGCRLLNLAEGGDEPFCSKETRAANGRKNAAALHSVHADPRKKRIWFLKQRIGHLLKKGELNEKQKQKLRLAAQKAPHLFGEYASL